MSILQVVTPITHDLGGFQVRRAVPSPTCRMVGPFIFVDQFGPARLAAGEGMDVRPHPHINLATVTWLFEGAIDHRDSVGSFATIRPGQVNLMTAGAGIVHSERSPPSERDGGAAMYGMQTWLALPDGREELAPAFEAVSELPLVEDTCAKARVIMGELWGKRAPTTCYADTVYAEIDLAPTGALPIDVGADERAVMLVGGQASIDGQELELYSLVVLKPGEAMTLASRRGGKVMLLGGEAFRTKRYVYWNFVSSSRERIEQAKDDWTAGRFPLVPGDEAEFIPLPDQPKTVSYP
jgi:redox-sensitive bicupin YhaK (pirin superfamily)